MHSTPRHDQRSLKEGPSDESFCWRKAVGCVTLGQSRRTSFRDRSSRPSILTDARIHDDRTTRDAAPPAWPVERRGRGHRYHHWLRNLSLPGEHYKSASRTVTPPFSMGHWWRTSALRRVDARRDRRRVSAHGRHLRVRARGLGAASGLSVRMGRAGDHPRRGAGRNWNHVRRVSAARTWLRSDETAV